LWYTAGVEIPAVVRRMTLADIRDLAIIVLAVIMALQSLVMLVAGLVVIRVALDLRPRVEEILANAQRTAADIRGTVRFTTDQVARPVIRTVAVIAGVRKGTAVLASRLLRRGSRDGRAR